MIDSLSSRFQGLRNATGNLAWTPLVRVSRMACLSLLSNMKVGRLEIIDVDGTVTICGDASAGSNATQTTLRILNEVFWLRLLLFADMGFAESYLSSEVSCTDLTSFFRLFIENKTYLSGNTITSTISNSITATLRAGNNLVNAKKNIAAHYDLSNDMFAAFLSRDMTYSCPIWLPLSHPHAIKETLEEAQMRKLDRFIGNARLKSTDRVLEIGTGWGSLAIRAVQETGCTVTSLTLSEEQKELADERIRDAGLEDKIKVLLCDYRALGVPAEGPFDKVVSCEMLEAVGRDYLTTYFQCIDKLLKKDGGIAVFQCITIPEARYEAYSNSEDFIRKYIFPGGHLPSVSQLVSSIMTGSNGTLVVDDIENIGPHYKKTLRLWNENFQAQFDAEIKPALLKEHEDWTKADIEVFRRKWIYYFTYCEAGFATKSLGDHIITCSREGALEYQEDVPM